MRSVALLEVSFLERQSTARTDRKLPSEQWSGNEAATQNLEGQLHMLHQC